MGHEVLVPDIGPEAGKTFNRRYTDIWQCNGSSRVMICKVLGLYLKRPSALFSNHISSRALQIQP
jgi:hypothetical protein